MHPVQVVSKIVLSFHCSPALCSARRRWGAKAMEKIDQDVYFLERSFLFFFACLFPENFLLRRRTWKVF